MNNKSENKFKSIPVGLGDRSYRIEIGEGLIASGQAAEFVTASVPGKQNGSVCIVTHPGLRAAYATPIEQGLLERGIRTSVVTIPPGERFKNLQTVARLYSAFVHERLDRKSLVVAVGGGVLGDLVGFAAASYLRGIAFVQVPTTLLAQVDASVGGKTGVDLPEGKNLVGAFHQPLSVIIDTNTLQTLPKRELRAGLAEVIKYGIIYDERFFLEVHESLPALLRRETTLLTHAIARSCAIKADVVGQDETEQGLRAILNFGHTVGHALEALTRYRRYKHGEAVGIGMVSACLIGERHGITPHSVTESLVEALKRAGLPIAFPAEIEPDSVIEAAQRDKKTLGGRLRFVLASRIGCVEVVDDVAATNIRESLVAQKQL